MLKAVNISFAIGGKKILDDVSLCFQPGSFNILLGPNGSGKSTFLRIFSGDQEDYKGSIYYNNENIHSFSKAALARYRAVMSQQPDLHFPLLVEEVVMMGRYPHFELNPGKKDHEICREVMRILNLQPFAQRNYLTLSGGEKQRVQFARVLAQIWEKPAAGNQRYLLLDEPLNNLDISYQQELLKLVRSFTGDDTVLVAVLHDINLASQYGDKLFYFRDGNLIAEGSPVETITAPLLGEVFGVSPGIMKNPDSGYPVIFFK